MQWERSKDVVPPVQYQLFFEQCMIRGQKYRVVRPFDDFPTDPNNGHKEWFFVGSSFIPYDGVLFVYVEDDTGQEWCIKLHETTDSDTIENFKSHVARVAGQFREDLLPRLDVLNACRPLKSRVRVHAHHAD